MTASISSVSKIAEGYIHACALLTSGSVTCWGQDLEGEIGIGARYTEVDTPTAVVGYS